MKQILQNLKSGETMVVEVPCPRVKPGHLLICTQASLISIGTERMLVDFGRANLLEKARQQPDKVKQVLDKVKTDGLKPTLDAVLAKLDQPLPLGYCNAGIVIDVGDGVAGFKIGDRIVSNGCHAEVVCVPENLCAKIPDNIGFDTAAFTVLSSIGLQGIRLIEPTIGETIAVIGLGLIGIITCQLLRASGCKVLGTDFDAAKIDIAKRFGVETVDLSKGEDPVSAAMTFTSGRGVDGVVITAATQSNEPIHQAATMSRKRGRIVLVGVTGLNLSRADFYEKELSFQVSCSYGPGRYDPNYEERGIDYPFGFVRWTEQRNFEAILQLMADDKLIVDHLITGRYDIAEACKAYEKVVSGNELGLLLSYPSYTNDKVAKNHDGLRLSRTIDLMPEKSKSDGLVRISFIGAGNFTRMVLLPAFKDTDCKFVSIASSTGVSGTLLATKFGFRKTTTDTDSIFKDSEVDTIVITTQHNSHAALTTQALLSGKNVFVEKPLSTTRKGLEEVVKAYRESRKFEKQPLLMVGFNRRFSPQVRKMRELIKSVNQPIAMTMTVNAGMIPASHWVHDPIKGGGRIIGEGCHFIDTLRYLADSKIVAVQSMKMGAGRGLEVVEDKMVINLSFANGSIGTIQYFANGDKSFPKERIEIFCANRVLQLNNFKALTGFGWPGFAKMNLWSQDKGHQAEVAEFVNSVMQGMPSPIPFEEIVEVTEASFAAVEMVLSAGNDRQVL